MVVEKAKLIRALSGSRLFIDSLPQCLNYRQTPLETKLFLNLEAGQGRCAGVEIRHLLDGRINSDKEIRARRRFPADDGHQATFRPQLREKLVRCYGYAAIDKNDVEWAVL